MFNGFMRSCVFPSNWEPKISQLEGKTQDVCEWEVLVVGLMMEIVNEFDTSVLFVFSL